MKGHDGMHHEICINIIYFFWETSKARQQIIVSAKETECEQINL